LQKSFSVEIIEKNFSVEIIAKGFSVEIIANLKFDFTQMSFLTV
jgi:hypothetical protein